MATITTDTYLDDGVTTRTAGETWAINGGNVIIRTDTRWHAQAPASMTGSLGSITISSTLGGGIVIDGSKVRWLAFNSGAGTVPAINTSVTQGGTTGTFLGVWTDLTAAPTAVGASMPSTGFMKLREVTGTFTSGALSGISASAMGADVPGWIEVVCDQSSNHTLSGVGSGFVITGDWFNLGTTTGTAGQQIQCPTNGGGSTTWIQGIQIETSPGSGVYEWYPSVATNWLTTALGTDIRAKYVQALAGGIVRIGSDGTNNIGFVPASGCNIRIPNVILRQCTTGARASNAAPSGTLATRPHFTTTYGAAISVDKAMIDWNFLVSYASSYSLTNTIVDCCIYITSPKCPVTITGCANGLPSNPTSSGALSITNSTLGATITSNKLVAFSQGYIPFSGSYLNNVTASNNIFAGVFARAGLSVYTIAVSYCNSWNLSNNFYQNGMMSLTTCSNWSVTGFDYTDNLFGTTNATAGIQSILLTTCSNIVVDGMTFGYSGTFTGVQPQSCLIKTINCFGGIVLKNAGTYASPLSCGSNSAYYPRYLHISNGPDSGVTLQRIYLSAYFNGVNQCTDSTSSNFKYEHIFGGYTTTIQVAGTDVTARSIASATSSMPGNLMNGTFFIDTFLSTTTGQFMFYGEATSTATSGFITTSLSTSNKSGYANNGQLLLKTSGDYVILQMPYFALGHTGFQNVAPTFTGTNPANHTLQYQIDKNDGNGWNGTWKTLNATNLYAETGISSSNGMKLQVKITANATSTTNAFQSLSIPTVSTSTAQSTNLYPLSVANLSFTGLATGSEVRCYTGTQGSGVEIGGIETTTGSTFSFSHSSGGTAGYIVILALGYQPVIFNYTYKTTDDSILIQPVIDRNFVA